MLYNPVLKKYIFTSGIIFSHTEMQMTMYILILNQYLINKCFRWTYVEESETSGVAVIELALPTGYFIHKPDMDKYVYSRAVPRLQRGRVYPKSAVFMFDYVSRLYIITYLKY